MSVNLPPGKPRPERTDGRLFLTEENLDRGTLTLIAAARRMEVRIRKALEEHKLSPVELSMLLEIAQHPGLDVAGLRDRLGGTTPTIARVLAGLEKADLIERPKAASDGRKRALRLSVNGQKIIDQGLNGVRRDMMHVYRQSGEPSVTGALDLLDYVTRISDDTDM